MDLGNKKITDFPQWEGAPVPGNSLFYMVFEGFDYCVALSQFASGGGGFSGVVPVVQGGTSVTTLTGYVKGNGTAPFTASLTIPASDIVGLPVFSGTKAEFNAQLTNGDFVFQGDIITSLVGNRAQFNTTLTDGDFVYQGDVITSLTGTKAQFNTALTDGNFVFEGDGQGFAAFEYVFDTATTEPVGSANVRFNAGPPYNTVTKVWVNDISSLGRDVSNYYTLVEAGMRLFFQDKDNAAQWVSFNCTGPIVDKGTYDEFPVVFRDKGTVNLAAQRILFNIAGGGTSAGGGDVIGPSSAVANNIVSFNGVTGKIIKDSGKAAPAGAIVGTTDTQQLDNKRIPPRAINITSNSATPTINSDTVDAVDITGQTVNITSMTTNLTGTPLRDETLWLSFTAASGTPTIAWGASFEASTVALPTVLSTTRLDVGLVWNVTAAKWRCVATA